MFIVIVSLLEALPFIVMPIALVYNQHKWKQWAHTGIPTYVAIASCVLATVLYAAHW